MGDEGSAKAVPVKVSYQGADGFMRAYNEFLDLDGVFVATNVPVPVGTQVQLTIELDPGKGIAVYAEVAWLRGAVGDKKAGVGLGFKRMAPNHRAWINKAAAKYRAEHGIVTDMDAQEVKLDRAHQIRRAVGERHLDDATLDVDGLEIDTHGATPVLGIDLGTSNSAACIYREGKAVVLNLAPEGQTECNTIASVVAYDDLGKVTVGQCAYDDLANNAKRTIYGSKRFIGRRYDHPEVQTMLSRYPYKVVPGAGGKVAVEINGRAISLTSVSAKILSYIRERAEAALKTPVERAIITVPAYYNQNQREAVTAAGRLAGLTIERIVNEPTAAAIAYGTTYQKAKKILVYDLGGGTFDVSIMRVGGNELTVLSTAGDTFLGGEDFDFTLVREVFEAFEKASGKQLSRNHSAMALLKVAAETCKKRLSIKDKSMIMVRDALLANGSTVRLEHELTRLRLEQLVAPLVKRTLDICDMALQAARLQRGAIDDVILVGGQTLMPCVRKAVGQHFDKKPRADLRADEVVAIGAGTLSHLHATGAAQELRDVLSMSIGIGIEGGQFKKLIERNTPLPHRVSHRMNIPKAQMKRYALELYQGEAPELVRNEHLGTLRVADVSGGTQDPVPVQIDLILSPDCLLKVRAINLATDVDIDILLNTCDT